MTMFVALNVGIFLGYFLIGTRLAPLLSFKFKTKVAMVVFFVTCGLTHWEQAFHALFQSDQSYEALATSTHMTLIHLVQVIAVWLWFTWGFRDLREVRRARPIS
jgi:hypothetical protein